MKEGLSDLKIVYWFVDWFKIDFFCQKDYLVVSFLFIVGLLVLFF